MKTLASLLCILTLGMNLTTLASEKNNTVRYGLPGFRDTVENSKVNSVTEYIILEHLLRPLVSYSTSGEIQGDLATSWDISNHFKTYAFELGQKNYFSDGTAITASHVIATFNRLIRNGDSIHYDISKFEKISLISEYKFVIELNSSDPFFLFDLEHPEFRILSKNDAQAKMGQQTYDITSGAYSLIKGKEKTLKLKLNASYPNVSNAPQFVEIL
ncbi:MAG: hypothetical protein CMP10_05200, partial [Zetaproteobacteria bacterium]|nr:hypothetical protein [Pseudobdellovibrionaceae bacterium]